MRAYVALVHALVAVLVSSTVSTLSTLSTAAPASAQTPDGPEVVITDLPPLPGAGTGLSAHGINDRGQVTGSAMVGGQRRAMLWDNGRVTDLGTLGGASRALAVNERGQVLGDSRAADGQNHAVLWTNGRMVDLGVVRSLLPDPDEALNDEGQAAGERAGYPNAAPVMWTVRDAR